MKSGVQRLSPARVRANRAGRLAASCRIESLEPRRLMAVAGPGAGSYRDLPGFTTFTLPANDDSSSNAIPLSFDLNFFGVTVPSVFVNNNGNVTLNTALSTFTPFDLNSSNRLIIAPFFADVDTSVGNVVTYGADTVDGHAAFGIDWNMVGYFSSGTDKLNTFQLVLIDRSDTGLGNFDIEFNYASIQWETGNASGGTGGLGGSSARAGFANGSGIAGTFFELPGSAVNGAFLDSNQSTGLANNSANSNVQGRYIFQARNGAISGGTTPTPSLSAPDLTSTGQDTYDFTVTYTDDTSINESTLGDSDVTVTGPGSTSLPVHFVGTESTDDSHSVRGRYRISAPSGTFTSANNGVYTIAMVANEVTDNVGTFVAAGTLGTFDVNVQTGVSDGARALLGAASIFTPTPGPYTFTVTYIDPAKINVATLDSSDLLVTGPNGFSEQATFVSVNHNSSGRTRVATYQIAGPAGGFVAANEGAYTVTLAAGQVLNRDDAAVASGALGGFNVNILTDGSLLGELGAGHGSQLAEDSSGRLHAVYYDTVAGALMYVRRSASGRFGQPIRIERIADPGDSIALTLRSDKPVVAYYDATAGALKYARLSNNRFSPATIDTNGALGHVGLAPSIVIDAGNQPAISYYDADADDLKLATMSSGAWTISTLDANGDVGGHSDIALDPLSHRLDIAYTDVTGETLKFARQDAGGTFGLEAITGSSADVNTELSLDFAAGGDAAVGYFDPTGILQLARSGSESWSITPITTAPTDGERPALFIDPATGVTRIAYFDRTNNRATILNNSTETFITQQLFHTGGEHLSVTRRSNGRLAFLGLATDADALVLGEL